MFVTVSPNIVEAEWRRNKKNKKKKKKKSEEKNLGRNYKTSRRTDGMPNYIRVICSIVGTGDRHLFVCTTHELS